MTILKAPANVSSISTSTGHAFTVVDGFVDTGTAPQAAIHQLMTVGKCTIATDADLAAADTATMQEPLLNEIASNKKALTARLSELGEQVDGRASLASLANQYKAAMKRKADAQAKEAGTAATAEADAAKAEAKAAEPEAKAVPAATTEPAPKTEA